MAELRRPPHCGPQRDCRLLLPAGAHNGVMDMYAGRALDSAPLPAGGLPRRAVGLTRPTLRITSDLRALHCQACGHDGYCWRCSSPGRPRHPDAGRIAHAACGRPRHWYTGPACLADARLACTRPRIAADPSQPAPLLFLASFTQASHSFSSTRPSWCRAPSSQPALARPRPA